MMENSWNKIEEEFLEFYQANNGSLSEESEQFLSTIGFVDDGEITNDGRQYLDSKYIFERGGWKPLLQNQLLNLRQVRELCQSFYGQKTNRENVELYFKSRTAVQDPVVVGRILGLLNEVDIVSYSKRLGSVQFLETDKVEEQGQDSYRTTHRTPYSNLMRFRKALRDCAGDLLWVDRHFSKKGLEPLAEEVTGNRFTSVRILSGPSNVGSHVRDDLKRFIEEMDNRGVDASWRVITDKSILRSIHDRWLLSSEGSSWNVPPINSVYGNQEAEILKTHEELDFEDWWDGSSDIINDWNNIQKFL